MTGLVTFFYSMKIGGMNMTNTTRAQDPEHKNKTSGWFKCPISSKCGGCQMEKLPYKAQLREKQKRVEELLGGFGPVLPILGMENPFHYRNKVHAVLATDKRGDPVSGIYAQGSHHVIPVSHCLLENEHATEIIHTTVQLIKKYQLRIYNEYTHRGLLRHLLVRISERTGEVMLTLVATDVNIPRIEDLSRELVSIYPDIKTVVVNQNSRQTSAVLGTREKVIIGDGYIEDILCGMRFRISSQSFYQVNSRQTEILYQTAIQQAGLTDKDVLMDAYCGTGTIGICAARQVKKLIGIEINRRAVDDAKNNAERNEITNAVFICGDAGNALSNNRGKMVRPDVVIMDPPRAGSSKQFLDSLKYNAPERIVYVSCNPETLARDLDYFLADTSYHMESATPVDMFPGTSHVETVCLLTHS